MGVTVTAPAGWREDVLALLPPGWEEGEAGAARVHVSLGRADGGYSIAADGLQATRARDRAGALRALDARMRAEIALHAPELIFLHAGVAVIDGRAIVLPGSTFTGKTTLVEALIRAGALYGSDEFAVLDARGRVHPYAKPLSIRGPDLRAVRTPAAALGAGCATGPAPVGLVLVTEYRPGARFDAQTLTSGEAVLRLLAHAVPAQTRPEQTMAFLRAAVEGAEAWATSRGEADETAAIVLASLPWRRG